MRYNLKNKINNTNLSSLYSSSLDLSDFLWLLDSEYIWSSYFLERAFFNKKSNLIFPIDIFNTRVKNISELMNIFLFKKKKQLPYTFILSDKGYSIIVDYISNYYVRSLFIPEEIKLIMEQLNPKFLFAFDGIPSDSFSSIVIEDSLIETTEELNSLIDNYLLKENII